MEQGFQLKGSLFTLSVLQLFDADLNVLDAQLSERVKLAPKFFQNAPVVIDLKGLDLVNKLIDFNELSVILRRHGLVPVGIKGADSAVQKQAQEAGFAVMMEKTSDERASKEKKLKKDLAPSALLITHPIRSGQQVYAQGGDLVVVSSVSPGAELLADGNIHVYGSLRGRALAGINGDTNARIFCNRLEAELVSIAGQYKIFEDLQENLDEEPKQLYLEDGQLIISTL